MARTGIMISSDIRMGSARSEAIDHSTLCVTFWIRDDGSLVDLLGMPRAWGSRCTNKSKNMSFNWKQVDHQSDCRSSNRRLTLVPTAHVG